MSAEFVSSSTPPEPSTGPSTRIPPAPRLSAEYGALRLLYVTHGYAPAWHHGGPAFKVPALAERLGARGHSVRVVTSNDRILAPILGSGTQRRVNSGVEVTYLRTWGRIGSIQLHTPPPDDLWQPQPDLLHIFGLYDLPGLYSTRRALRRGIPYVLEPMGMFLPLAKGRVRKAIYHRLVGRRLIQGAAVVIATSPMEREELLQGGVAPSRIRVRRNGLDLASLLPLPERGNFRRRWGIAPTDRIVLFLGRMVPKKNVDLLIDAVAHAGMRASRLVIAGNVQDAALNRRLRAQVARVLPDTIFTGPLYGTEKTEALVDADLFVLPSFRENFGNAAVEAAAVGTPVIVSDQCGVAPWIQDAGGRVVPCDREALGTAIREMLQNAPALKKRAQDAAEELRRRLDWNEPVAEMETIYREVLRADRLGSV